MGTNLAMSLSEAMNTKTNDAFICNKSWRLNSEMTNEDTLTEEIAIQFKYKSSSSPLV